MKPLALIIVIAIITAAVLIFTPVSLNQILVSFPLFQSLADKNTPLQQGNIAVDRASIIRSIDSGTTWFPQVAIDAGSSIPSVSVLNLTLDHIDSNIIYAGTEGDGLYKSVNNGQNWEKMYDRNRILADDATIFDVAQDPRDVNNMYIAAFQNKYGVFLKSTDGGASFVQTYISQLENYPVEAIALHPSASNMVYIGTGQGGVFVSEDFGETWKVVKWLTGSVTNIVINPYNSFEMYAVVRGRGLFRSADGGREWKEFSRELSRISAHNNVMMFTMDPGDPNILYLALANGLIRSNNKGGTWEFVKILIPPNALPVDSIAVDPKNSRKIYVGVGALVYQSLDGGINWSVQKLATQKRISEILIDPKDTRSIFLGMKNVKK
ncbi:MAG: YCF48-related protein [Candidatus Azambacteria bacterium]|nr:YCF48-related protein [Candidatus Azambacteria bacterium]